MTSSFCGPLPSPVFLADSSPTNARSSHPSSFLAPPTAFHPSVWHGHHPGVFSIARAAYPTPHAPSTSPWSSSTHYAGSGVFGAPHNTWLPSYARALPSRDDVYPQGARYPNYSHQNRKSSHAFTDRSAAQRSASLAFSCDACNRSFSQQHELDLHLSEHVECSIEGCTFKAHPKVVALHKKMQHDSGLAKKIMCLDTPEEIAKWRAERKKNFPTAENIARRKAELAEKEARGEILEDKPAGKMGKGRMQWGAVRQGKINRNATFDAKKAPPVRRRRRVVRHKQPSKCSEDVKAKPENHMPQKRTVNHCEDLSSREDRRTIKKFRGTLYDYTREDDDDKNAKEEEEEILKINEDNSESKMIEDSIAEDAEPVEAPETLENDDKNSQSEDSEPEDGEIPDEKIVENIEISALEVCDDNNLESEDIEPEDGEIPDEKIVENIEISALEVCNDNNLESEDIEPEDGEIPDDEELIVENVETSALEVCTSLVNEVVESIEGHEGGLLVKEDDQVAPFEEDCEKMETKAIENHDVESSVPEPDSEKEEGELTDSDDEDEQSKSKETVSNDCHHSSTVLDGASKDIGKPLQFFQADVDSDGDSEGDAGAAPKSKPLHTQVGGSLGMLMSSYADSDSEDESPQDKPIPGKVVETCAAKEVIKKPGITVKSYKYSTLLQKLLAREICHERNVILQCVRYIVKKNYFGIGQN